MTKGRSRFYWVLYPLWAAVCVVMFLALEGAADPSRPTGRLTPMEARAAALDCLRQFDSERFGSYQVIDGAVYRDVEKDEKIWIVICDATPRSALKRAVVVDLDADSGAVVRTRRPGGVEVEEFPIP